MKHSYLVDTNIILRFLLEDNLPQQKQVARWFRKAEQNKLNLYIKPIVVAESCYVLESYYKMSRQKIGTAFEVLLSQRWLHVEQRNVLLALWPWYIRGFHFVDSYLQTIAQIEDMKVLTFDKKILTNN